MSIDSNPTTPSSARFSIDNKATFGRVRTARFARWTLAHDLAHLFRSSSSASESSTTSESTERSISSNKENTVHEYSRFEHIKADDEKRGDEPIAPEDIAPQTLLFNSPMTSQPDPPTPSRRAKIYEFLSRSASRSRSKSTRRSSKSSVPADSDLTTVTTSATSASTDHDATEDPHLSSDAHRRHQDHSKPLTRSPSRPLSSNTRSTASTITPLNAPTRSRTPRAIHPHTTPGPLLYPNDMADHQQYDPTMPPPPVPPTSKLPPTSKRKSKPPTLFGISLPGRSRPTTPKDDRIDLVSPPLTPARGRSGWDPTRRRSKDKASMERQRVSGPSAPAPIHAPKPRSAIMPPPFAGPPIPITAEDSIARPRSSPPRPGHTGETYASSSHHPPSRPPSSLSARGRCSPMISFGFFTRSRSRGGGGSPSRSTSRKAKERATEKEKEHAPKVGAPTSNNGPPLSASAVPNGIRSARHGSFDFERVHSGTQPGLAGVGSGGGPQGFRPGLTEIKRSVSSGGAERRKRTAHTHAYTHANAQTSQAYSQSTSARAHLRARHDATPPAALTASAHSQSTATGTTGTGVTTDRRLPANLPTGEGSWGRRTRTAAWARAGVHPPFAFESAASASNGRASPAVSDRAKDSVESRRNGRREPSEPRSDGGGGQWREREVELGLGLAWAPSKIRVREFTAVKEREGSVERELARKRERERELEREREREQTRMVLEGGTKAQMRAQMREMGYADLRKKEDKEVTARYKAVLGERGFDAFKKYVRRFDAEIIPLDGPNGLLVKVRRLLDAGPVPLSEQTKREMIDDLNRIVLENS